MASLEGMVEGPYDVDAAGLLLEHSGTSGVFAYVIEELARKNPGAAEAFLSKSISFLDAKRDSESGKGIKRTPRRDVNVKELVSAAELAYASVFKTFQVYRLNDIAIAQECLSTMRRLKELSAALDSNKGRFNPSVLFAGHDLKDETVVSELRGTCKDMLSTVNRIRSESTRMAAEEAERGRATVLSRATGALDGFLRTVVQAGIQAQPFTRVAMAGGWRAEGSHAQQPTGPGQVDWKRLQQPAKQSTGPRFGEIGEGFLQSAAPQGNSVHVEPIRGPTALSPQASEMSGTNFVISHAEKSGMRCGVCLGLVKPGLPIATCPSGHVFHASCEERVGNCPKCGSNSTKGNVDKKSKSDLKIKGTGIADEGTYSEIQKLYQTFKLFEDYSEDYSVSNFKDDMRRLDRIYGTKAIGASTFMNQLHGRLTEAVESIDKNEIPEEDYAEYVGKFKELANRIKKRLKKGSPFRYWLFDKTRWLNTKEPEKLAKDLENVLEEVDGTVNSVSKTYQKAPAALFETIGPKIARMEELWAKYINGTIWKNVIQAVGIGLAATIFEGVAMPKIQAGFNQQNTPDNSGKGGDNNSTNGTATWTPTPPVQNSTFPRQITALFNQANHLFNTSDVFAGKANVSLEGNNYVYKVDGQVFLKQNTTTGDYLINLTGEDGGLQTPASIWLKVVSPKLTGEKVGLEVILNNAGDPANSTAKLAKYYVIASPPAENINGKETFITGGTFRLVNSKGEVMLDKNGKPAERPMYTKDGAINTSGVVELAVSVPANSNITGVVDISTACGSFAGQVGCLVPDMPYLVKAALAAKELPYNAKEIAWSYNLTNTDGGLSPTLEYTLTSVGGDSIIQNTVSPAPGDNNVKVPLTPLAKGDYIFKVVDKTAGRTILDTVVHQSGMAPEASGLTNESVNHDFVKNGVYTLKQTVHINNEPGEVTHYKWEVDVGGQSRVIENSTTGDTVSLETLVTSADVKAAGGALQVNGTLQLWDDDNAVSNGQPVAKEYQFTQTINRVNYAPTVEFNSKSIDVTQGYASKPIGINASDLDGDLVEKVEATLDGSTPVPVVKDGDGWKAVLGENLTGLAAGKHVLTAKAYSGEQWSELASTDVVIHSPPKVEKFDAYTYFDFDAGKEFLHVEGQVTPGSGLNGTYVTLTDHLGNEANISLGASESFSKDIPLNELASLNVSQIVSAKAGALDVNGANTDKHSGLEVRVKDVVFDGVINYDISPNYNLLGYAKSGKDLNVSLQAATAGFTDIKNYSKAIWSTLYSDSSFVPEDNCYQFGLQFIEAFNKYKHSSAHINGNACAYITTRKKSDNTKVMEIIARQDDSQDGTYEINYLVNLLNGNAVPLSQAYQSMGSKLIWDADSGITGEDLTNGVWQMISSVGCNKYAFSIGAQNDHLQVSDSAWAYLRPIANGTGSGNTFTAADEVKLGNICTTIKDLLQKLPADKNLLVDFNAVSGRLYAKPMPLAAK